MFEDKLKADINKLSPSEETKSAVLAILSKKPKIKYFKFSSVIAAALAVVLAVGVFYNSYDNDISKNVVNTNQTQENTTNPQATEKAVEGTKKPTQTTTTNNNDESVYKSIYKLVLDNYEEDQDHTYKKHYSDSAPGYVSLGGGELAENVSAKDFSSTNTQHEDVDEEDIIKTDGNFIYRLKEGWDEIYIYKADGKNTKKVYTLDMYPLLDDYYYSDEDELYSDAYSSGMYLYKDRLVVIYDTYTKILAKDCKCKFCSRENYEDFAQVFIFDISNRAKPRFLKQFKQSGYYEDSRMIGDKLYVFTNHYIDCGEKIKENEKTRYLPILSQGNTQEIQDEKNICIADDTTSTRYSVMCSYDVQGVNRVDDFSCFGGDGVEYVSKNNAYLTEKIYRKDWLPQTKVTKISISAGKFKLVASGKFDGVVLNQFSMDEYKGYLRLVATQDKWSNNSYNSLCIFDKNMKKVSSIEKLAKGERIYSARFMGEYAYFVTFKETDPLFCADVSDPKHPKIVSELKIPGFSNYLHPFGNNKLFGFGESATKRGEITGLKMSMFNIKNKQKVTQENVLELGEGFSSANYDHKAILVSDKKNLISFAVETEDYDKNIDDDVYKGYYYLYSYNQNKGFKQLAKIEIYNIPDNDDEKYFDYDWLAIRGLYIEDYFYISDGEKMIVVDLNTYKTVKTINK